MTRLQLGIRYSVGLLNQQQQRLATRSRPGGPRSSSGAASQVRDQGMGNVLENEGLPLGDDDDWLSFESKWSVEGWAPSFLAPPPRISNHMPQISDGSHLRRLPPQAQLAAEAEAALRDHQQGLRKLLPADFEAKNKTFFPSAGRCVQSFRLYKPTPLS